MLVGAVAIPLQIVAGDISARFDAENEPTKFAALEALYRTQAAAPLTIGGWANPARAHTTGAIELPYLLSVLASGDPHATLSGLDRVRPDDLPPVAAVHLSFDAMVGSGSALLAIGLAWAVTALRRRALSAWTARAIALGGVLGLVALQAGWFVTELGRQPWIARGMLRTTDAATIAPHLDLAFYGFSVIYAVLAATTWWLLLRLGRPAQPTPTTPRTVAAPA
jgi:cytochrome d ubiquinol oxidase subunit I